MTVIAAFTRPDLFSQVQAARLLGVRRDTIADVAPRLGLEWKRDPSRNGKMLDRDDMDRLASALNSTIDWSSAGPARVDSSH